MKKRSICFYIHLCGNENAIKQRRKRAKRKRKHKKRNKMQIFNNEETKKERKRRRKFLKNDVNLTVASSVYITDQF